MGPVGRLTDARNVIVEKYLSSATEATKVLVQPRAGFESLTTTVRDIDSGETITVPWTSPQLFSSLAQQLVSVCTSKPRVWNGTTWSGYPDARVVSNRLSQEVYHTPNRVSQAPTSAHLNGVTCFVWTETVGSSEPIQVAYVGFKGSNGAWIVDPQVLYAPGSSATKVMARAVTDGTRFWVVCNYFDGSQVFQVNAYDTNGDHLAQNLGVTKNWGDTPGFWDVRHVPSASAPGRILLVQPRWNEPDPTEIGVSFAHFTFSAGTIHVTEFDDDTMQCWGPVQILTNDLADNQIYLGTVGPGESGGGVLWGYRTDGLGVYHEFTFDINCETTPDTITGWAEDSGVSGQPDVNIAFGVFSDLDPAHGPEHDPALRRIHVYNCDWADTVTELKQINSLCQVSRAFAIDGEYHSYTYWQSGSGKQLTPESEVIEIEPGDEMIGADEQELDVRLGDTVNGSEFSIPVAGGSAYTIYTSDGQTAFNIDGTDPDKVELVYATDSTEFSFARIPVGTPLLKWTLSGIAVADASGGRLIVSGSSIPSADASWDIMTATFGGGTPYLYTMSVNTAGNSLTPGNFSTAGTATIQSMTLFRIPNLSDYVSQEAADLLLLGPIMITGATGGNNGVHTIRGVVTEQGAGRNFAWGPGIWVNTNLEFSYTGGYAAAISPGVPGTWSFANERFDASYAGTKLFVDGNPIAGNNGEFTVSSGTTGGSVFTPTAVGLLPQVFSTPVPRAFIRLAIDQVAYTFTLTNLIPDYSYLGALMSIQGSNYEENDGIYRITAVDPDTGTFTAIPTNGQTNQRNERLDNATITVFKSVEYQPQFQPTWFLTPLTGSQAQVGCFERGLAYADWRNEGDSGQPATQFPLSVSDVSVTATGTQLILPYRSQSVTSALPLVTTLGQVNAAVPTLASTVGLKAFTLESGYGQAIPSNGELLLPGPMPGVFTASGFFEHGTNLGLEQPWLIEQSEADAGTLGLTKNGKYQVVAVAEYTDENGDRIFSPPSPALNFQLTGDNNVAKYGGRLLCPLDTSGNSTATADPPITGVTNRLVGISLYRTNISNGVQSVQRYKVTDDLNVNGLAPASDLNPSGFAFPDNFTWTYVDSNPDVMALSSEILYTDKTYLPRFPAPPFRQGVITWKNRTWVIGYDGAVWMSGEKTEGDAIWFFPGFRYLFPDEDKPVALAPMDDYLIVCCQSSIWYIPAVQFPDSAGRNGFLPNPVKLPFSNGCTGHAQALGSGVAYSSTAGGVWLVTRGLTNQWLSSDLEDTFSGQTISALAVDENQRLHVTTSNSGWLVYDQTVGIWYRWALPATGAQLSALLDGQVAFHSPSNGVAVYSPARVTDLFNGTTTAIAPDITFAPISLGNVRGQKRLWAIQLVGQYRGPHQLNAVLTYPDDAPNDSTTYDPYTPSSTEPYLLEINPQYEECSTFGLRVYATFTDIISPGDCFRLELISCEVGIDRAAGLNKFVQSRRIT